mmetsp:Transcript_28677/g.60832  ORF Transcript_28677/g.60832 Transcript_28677/m.60832 type:complete len:255 (+) Transcript_28677:203-967(+)
MRRDETDHSLVAFKLLLLLIFHLLLVISYTKCNIVCAGVWSDCCHDLSRSAISVGITRVGIGVHVVINGVLHVYWIGHCVVRLQGIFTNCWIRNFGLVLILLVIRRRREAHAYFVTTISAAHVLAFSFIIWRKKTYIHFWAFIDNLIIAFVCIIIAASIIRRMGKTHINLWTIITICRRSFSIFCLRYVSFQFIILYSQRRHCRFHLWRCCFHFILYFSGIFDVSRICRHLRHHLQRRWRGWRRWHRRKREINL